MTKSKYDAILEMTLISKLKALITCRRSDICKIHWSESEGDEDQIKYLIDIFRVSINAHDADAARDSRTLIETMK